MKALLAVLIVFISSESFSQKSYTLVFLHKKADAENVHEDTVKKLMEGHMANMARLAKEGKLLVAGPFHGGGGIFVFSTTDRTEAEQWLSTDPGVQARRWNVEMQPYTPRYGGICPVGEKYEMTTYSFVRFDAVVSKFNAATYPEIMRKHNEHLKSLTATGNVVTEAIFGEHDGGILIMKGDVSQELFEKDPGVQEGLIELDIKKLYIAKGSFCEN